MERNRFIIPAVQAERQWLDWWFYLVPAPGPVLGLSPFGDWFIDQGEEGVWRLDLLEGAFESLGVSVPEFWAQLGTDHAEDEWLQVGHVLVLEDCGLRLGPGQCYTYRVPPRIGGAIAVDNMAPGELGGYQLFCAQLHRQLDLLPGGAQVIRLDIDSAGALTVQWKPHE
jgi:hypothetical protein